MQDCCEPGDGSSNKGRNRTAHGVGERGRCGLEAAECGGYGQEGGQGPDEVVESNRLGLPRRRGGTLDLLLGILPLGADHVPVTFEKF